VPIFIFFFPQFYLGALPPCAGAAVRRIEVDERAFQLFMRIITGEASHVILWNRQREQSPCLRGGFIPGIPERGGFFRAKGNRNLLESFRDTFATGLEVGFLPCPGPKESSRRFLAGKGLESLEIFFGKNSFGQLKKIPMGLRIFQINSNPGIGRESDGNQIMRMGNTELEALVMRQDGTSAIGIGEFNGLGRLMQIEAQAFPQQAPAQDKARAVFGNPESRGPLAVLAIQKGFQKNQRVPRLGNLRDPDDHMSGQVFAGVRGHC